jgi:hypothetical protein
VTLHTTLGELKLEVFCEAVPKAAEVRAPPPPPPLGSGADGRALELPRAVRGRRV